MIRKLEVRRRRGLAAAGGAVFRSKGSLPDQSAPRSLPVDVSGRCDLFGTHRPLFDRVQRLRDMPRSSSWGVS